MSKYNSLIRILDRLRGEAPKEYKTYHPDEADLILLNQARAKAFVHLYLKVNFGLLDFKDRDEFFTDGTDDGGIDAYYIDFDTKIVYFVQSKFRATEKNFEQTEIMLNEILSMDVNRILDGEKSQENGKAYNSKILTLIRKIQNIEDIGRYKYRIILLANINSNKITDSKLKLITGNLPYVVYNFERCYEELVFPVISGTYYNASDLIININLTNKTAGTKISYSVNTEFRDCSITVLFVPTVEIAKLLLKYKNSVLKYNPRSFLELKQNSVNAEIRNTIVSKNTNEFALFNNGITMLSDDTDYNEKVAQKGKGQLMIKNPQIINGGQTAYTLSTIYAENPNEEIFENKEVLLKIITFDNSEKGTESDKIRLIEAISRATNRQTEVTMADRRSNDKVQIELQKLLFSRYGLFYERKLGEFSDGLKNKYISNESVIDRNIFLKICLATKGNASGAKAKKKLFHESNFYAILGGDDYYDFYLIGFECYQKLSRLNNFNQLPKNSSLSKNIYAGITAIILNNYDLLKNKKYSEINVDSEIEKIINEWANFEDFAIKQPHNSTYFKVRHDATNEKKYVLNFEGYYKVTNLNKDLMAYFGKLQDESDFQLKNDEELFLSEEQIADVRNNLPKGLWEMGIHKVIAQKLGLPNNQVWLAISKIKQEMNI